MRGILNGVIPASEVESNDYIQECLGDFDVNRVLEVAGMDAYRFKAEISSKEALREQLQGEDATVIQRCELWWDKYQTSLHQIDQQVAEAEVVMKGYLSGVGI